MGRGLCRGPGGGNAFGMRRAVGGTDGGEWVEYRHVQDLELAGHDEGGISPWVCDRRTRTGLKGKKTKWGWGD